MARPRPVAGGLRFALSFDSVGGMLDALKSSRLFQNNPVTVARTASDYTPEEQARFREVFQQMAARYRQRARTAYVIMVVCLAALILGFVLPGRAGGWGGGVFVLCLIILMGCRFFSVRLVCPGCSNDLERRGLGPYCPKCGSSSVSPGGWFQAPRCTACGKSLRRGRYRRYQIRACTHCGLMLDERGV